MWPSDSNGIIRRSTALNVGISDLEIKRALRRREITILDRGRYVQTQQLPAPDELGPDQFEAERYRLKVLAAADDGVDELIVSHESAAAVHGMPTLNTDHRFVHFATSRAASGRKLRSRHVHPGLPPNSTTLVGSVLVTTLARTAVDIAACSDFPRGLAACDSALRMGVAVEELEAEAGKRRMRGAANVRAAIRYADGRAANPGESWSRALMIQAGFPIPDLQTHFRLLNGNDAFADFSWNRKLAGEYDGKRKYIRDLLPGEDAGSAVYREKQREIELRRVNVGVVRWITQDLRDGSMLVRVGEALKDERLL
ncbi:hypothetical protein [Gordonia sp. (in: high G+C Gram-positive bacteria)]|uniref:hypothetical protein n=1 Tax=Gordonia sp. (in: high G+C Gram-positive bacteria) TaxID=84139 RepID=UPI003C70C62B